MTERYTFFMFCAAVTYRDSMRRHGTAKLLFEKLSGFPVYVVQFTPAPKPASVWAA
jgi:hypothetical protein